MKVSRNVALILLFVFVFSSCSNDDNLLAFEEQDNTILPIDSVSNNSQGQPSSPSLKKGSFFLTSRFYYASDNVDYSIQAINQPDGSKKNIPVYGNIETSIKTNALGDEQVLFYDYYAPQKIDVDFNQHTVIFYHGGGFQSGAANDVCTFYHLQEWLEMGFHGLIIGYRRGWFGDGSESPGGEAEVSLLESQRFEMAAEMALEDAQQAWSHYNSNSEGHGRWFSGQASSQVYAIHGQSEPKYVVIGNSAGGSLVSRTVHTNTYPSPDIQIKGAIVGFGTHKTTEAVLSSHNNVPTIVVAGLFDDLSPFYDNPIFYDQDMPQTKGTMTFYEELIAKGYRARMLISAQKGHGWASFGKDYSSSACGKSVPDFIIDPNASDIESMSDHYALPFFFKPGSAFNYQHYRFAKDAKMNGESNHPRVDDEGGLYEQIGLATAQKANVLTIDPAIVGLNTADHHFVDGFYYGNDLENGLGELNITDGFRYEPYQTEFQIALENGNKPSDIRAKYNF